MARRTGKATDEPGTVRVHTHRSGVFTFRVGVDLEAVTPLFQRVEDAHRRFKSVPVLPDVANRLEREVVAASVFGTNAIEGGTLSPEEVAGVLDRPQEAKAEAQRRVANLGDAYRLVETFAQRVHARNRDEEKVLVLALEERMITDLHRQITQGLTHRDNVPGQYRNNPKERLTRVGDAAHGGVYTPPKCLDDVRALMEALVEWANSEAVGCLSPLVRAPLIHYYFERIHPFWDGNGRVGRALEAAILLTAGYRFAPWALARHYFDDVDAYYTVFRQAEKAEEHREPFPNTPFVAFFLETMLATIDRLHDRVNNLLRMVLFENHVNDSLRRRAINARQHAILLRLSEGGPIPLGELRGRAWYMALYERLTTKTRDRDLKKLKDLDLIRIGPDGVRVVLP